MLRLVIMGCGRSRRMGQDKLRLPWEKTTVMGHVVQEALAAQSLFRQTTAEGGSTVEIVVAAALPPEEYLAGKVIREFQEMGNIWRIRPRGTVPETIRAGLEKLGNDTLGIGFLPGDQVGLESSRLAGLMKEFQRREPAFLVPVAGQAQGNPVFFHRSFVSELLALEGEQGGRVILERHPADRLNFEVNPEFMRDVDTPEDYRRFLDNT